MNQAVNSEKEISQLSKNWHVAFIPILVLVIGCICTLVSVVLYWQAVSAVEESHYRNWKEAAKVRLESRVAAYEEGLLGARGVFHASDEVTREEFWRMGQSWDLSTKLPGARGIGFIQRVSNDEASLNAFLAASRADEAPDYVLKPLPTASDAAVSPDDEMVVKYIYPLGPNRFLRGLMLGKDNTFYEQLMRIGASGEVVLSNVQIHDSRGLPMALRLLLIPVYDHQRDIQAEIDDMSSLVGWLFIPMTSHELFSDVLDDMEGAVSLRLYDPVAPDTPIYDSQMMRHLNNPTEHKNGHTIREPIELAGATMIAEYRFTEPPVSSGPGVLWIASLGFIATTLIASLTWYISRRSFNVVNKTRESMHELQNLEKSFQFTADMVLIVDALTWRLIFANEVFQSMLMKSMDELKTQTLMEYVPEITFPQSQRALTQARQNPEKAIMVSVLMPHPSGVERHMDLNIRYMEMTSEPARYVIIGRDMTEREREEQTRLLKRTDNEARMNRLLAYRDAIDHHSIVAVTDRSGVIIEVNQQFCDISGYTREELIGQTHRMVNSGVHSKAMWVGLWRTITHGKTWRGIICNKRRDGTFYWVETSIAPMFNDNREITGYCAVRTDVTAIKEAQQELEHARLDAEKANVAKSEFLANMSHEIRTPLTAVLGFTEIIHDQMKDEQAPQSRLDMINTVIHAGDHLLEVINDILDLSKIEAGKMDMRVIQTPLLETLEDVMKLMQARIDLKGLEFELIFQTPMPDYIHSDQTRLRQILMNLIGNAVKFTDQGFIRVVISAEEEEGRPTLLKFNVIDSGCGMDISAAEKIFAPFEQSDNSPTRATGGTGLGLTISHRLATLMGGHIKLLRTAINEGSEFQVTLPWIKHKDADVFENMPAYLATLDASVSQSQDTLVLNGKFLVVEDSKDNQRLISYHLKKTGADVVIANHGREALDLLSNDDDQSHDYDVIISDIQMPEMDGYQLVQELRARHFRVPIIALTAHAMSDDREKCLAIGFDAYLVKPIESDQLVRVCHRWLKQSELLSKMREQ